MSALSRLVTLLGAGKARLLPLAALVAWLILSLSSHADPHSFGREQIVWFVLGILTLQWLITLAGVRIAPALRIREWILWGVVFRMAGLLAVPMLDDDYHRFLWDGRMFAQTGNPYASSPREHFGNEEIPEPFAELLDRINYPDVPSIYGPVTQLGFLTAYLTAPAQLWPWKLLLLLADLALLVSMRTLSGNRDSVRAVAFVALCPLSIFETAFNAHPDALAIAVLAIALCLLQKGRNAWAGVLCGVALGAKIFALIAVPFLVWRGGWKTAIAFAVAGAGIYTPFWLMGSGADFEALRVMGGQWEFNSSGFALLKLLSPIEWARPAALLLTAAGWSALFLLAVKRSNANNLVDVGFYAFAWVFLWSPVFNPWYALWLLPFVAVRRGIAGPAILALVSLSHLTRSNLGGADLDGFSHPIWARLLEFGGMALAFVIEHLVKRRQSGITAPSPQPTEASAP